MYWSSKRGRAKVLLPSGAVITVSTQTVVLLNGGNNVADEISVDDKCHNVRFVQPAGGRTNERNENLPTMGNTSASPQPRMGRATDVTHHVA